MADIERITPPVPTLPPPVGRGVGSRRRKAPERERPPPKDRNDKTPDDSPPLHIDEYV